MEEAKPVKTLPRHVAVIMDGNGRWAKNRHMPRVEGHRRGVSAVESCTEAARRAGIKALTLFAFSSENWKRPEEEVSALMRLFGLMLVNQREKLVKNDIRLHVAGDVSAFSDPLRQAIEETERATEHCSAMQLTICANYGGRWDITQGVRLLAKQVQDGTLLPEQITEDMLSQQVCMHELAPVDLVIRTGGEHRISNFLIWQIAYAELYFTDVLWPDFAEQDFEGALHAFVNRERRFGGTEPGGSHA